MSSHNEQLEPTPFDVVQPAPAAPATTVDRQRREGTPPWVLPALGGLLLLAVLVIFWLPERVNAPAPEAAGSAPTGAAPENAGANPVPENGAGAAPAGPDVSPWSDAQLAKLRREAQEVLAQLLEVQESLEGRGVQLWAAEQVAAVATLAKAGDELYRSRDYAAAKSRYEEGLAQLRALEAGIPAELSRQLALADESLESGDLAAAGTALDRAEAIDPGNAEAAALRRRVEALPQLLTLLEQAGTAEQAGDLPGAIALLKQATALDPGHQRSAEELRRVQADYQQYQFNEAMSAGYAALDAGQFDTARKAFRRAAQLQSGSSEAASALQEVEAAATAHRLASLQNSGSRLEQQEQWQQAIADYEQAQKIDPNVMFAREGLARSRDRARLDKQFRTAIDDPQRLSDPAVARATAQMLAVAQKISPRGPVLDGQIKRLEILLKQANTPIGITLRSDGQTEVAVYKVAKLGRFEQTGLDLKPGTYVAVGSRIGYRDVRVEFTVKPDGPPPQVVVTCTEAI